MPDPKYNDLEVREAFARLIEQVETVVPYVLATLPHAAGIDRSNVKTDNPEWAAVHRGRGASSSRQLEAVLRQARLFKEKL